MKYANTLRNICREPKVNRALIVERFKNRENLTVTVKDNNIGKPGYDIQIDEDIFFVTERPIDYYNKRHYRTTSFQSRILEFSIPVPLYLGGGKMDKDVHEAIISSDPNIEIDVWLRRVFGIEIAMSYFNNYFSKSDSLGDYKTIIFEAIEAYYLGMDNIAIMSLIPVFEGGLRNIQHIYLESCHNNVRADIFEKGLKDLILLWGRKKLKNYSWYPGKDCNNSVEIDFFTHICRQCDVMNAFMLFFKNVLYKSSKESSGGLNRHLILHMLKNDFNNPANFIRMFLALTHITFIESLENHELPFLWPGINSRDMQLASDIRIIYNQFGKPRRKLLKNAGIATYNDIVKKTD